MLKWQRMRKDWRRLLSENWTGLALLGLFALVAIIGGGSRADILSLMILRPVGAFAFILGLAMLTPNRYAAFKPLLIFALAILAAIAFQLIPLPPGLWGWLPGHGPAAEAARLVGMDDVWRPISLYPAFTWNALFAALVPFSLLLFFAAAHPRWRHYWLLAVVIFGFASAIVGLLQVGGPRDGALYFYRITNFGTAVGLFSNGNHNGIFMALMPPLLAYAAFSLSWARRTVLALFAAILWFFFLLAVLAIGSRLGLGLFVLSSFATFFMIPAEIRGRLPMPRRFENYASIAYPAALAVLILVVALLSGTNVAMHELLDGSLNAELRGRILPSVLRMIGDFFPFGGGGGTFPMTYFFYEPAELLMTAYVNHVHNDYLEIFYAYGLPGMALIISGLAAWAYYAIKLWNAALPRSEQMAIRASVVALGTLFLASAGDYPLRTPSLAVIAVLLAATLLRHRDAREKKLGL